MSEELSSGRRVAPDQLAGISRRAPRIGHLVTGTAAPREQPLQDDDVWRFVIHYEDARGGESGIGECVFVVVLH